MSKIKAAPIESAPEEAAPAEPMAVPDAQAARIAEMEAKPAALEPKKIARPPASWSGSDLVSAKGTVIGSIRKATPTYHGPREWFAPVLFLGSGELLGPEGSRAEAVEWLEVRATAQGWDIV